MPKTRRAPIAGALAALCAVLALLTALPGIALPAMLALPLPIVAAGLKVGAGGAVLCSLGAVIMVGLTQGPVGVLLLLNPLAVGLSVGALAARKAPLKRQLIWGTTAVLIAMVLQWHVGATLSGVDPVVELARIEETALGQFEESFLKPAAEKVEELSQKRRNIMDQVPVIMQELEGAEQELKQSKEQLQGLELMQNQWKDLFQNPFPFVLFVAFVLTALTLRLARLMADRFRLGWIPELAFRTWKCPKALSLIFFAWILLVPAAKSAETGFLADAYVQKAIFGFGYGMQLVYLLSGLALIAAFAWHYRLSIASRILLVGTAIVFLQPLMLAALFDSFFNFRNRWIANSDKGA